MLHLISSPERQGSRYPVEIMPTKVAVQLYAIVSGDVRLLLRGNAFRVALAVASLPGILLIVRQHDASLGQRSFGLGFIAEILPLTALLAGIITVYTLTRDRPYKLCALILARPISTSVYLLGKVTTGAVIMLPFLVLIMLQAVAYQVTGGGPLDAVLGPGFFVIALPSLLCYTASLVSITLIIGKVLPTIIIVTIASIATGFYLPASPTFASNIWAAGVTYMPVLGLGPDGETLVAGRVLWGCIAASLLIAAFLLAPIGLHRARTRSRLFITAPLLSAALLLPSVAYVHFQRTVTSVWGALESAPPGAVQAVINDYRLDLTISPRSGAIRGQVRFKIRNTGVVPLRQFPILLNDGLSVQYAEIDGVVAVVMGRSTWFRDVRLPRILPAGETTTVTLHYEGVYKTWRYEYGSPYREGFLLDRDVVYSGPGYLTQIGHGYAVLYGSGTWYPTPWTNSVEMTIVPPLGWSRLHIRLYGKPVGASSASRLVYRDGMTDLWWKLSARLPGAVIAYVPESYGTLVIDQDKLISPSTDAANTRLYGSYATAYHDLLRFFGADRRHVTLVVVPANEPVEGNAGDEYVPLAVGVGLVTIPINALNIPQPLPYSRRINIADMDTVARYTAALEDLSEAWWQDRVVDSAGLILSTGNGVWLPRSYDNSASALIVAGYTAVATAELRYGPSWYVRQMRWRRAVHHVLSAGAITSMSDLYTSITSSGLWPQAEQYGLATRLNHASLVGALDDLRAKVGSSTLRRDLIALSRMPGYSVGSITIACTLNHLTGFPVATDWLKTEPNQSVTVPKGCA